jgi:cytochrome c peroxidase
VFKTGVITSKEVAYALAQFIRTQSSTNARFDQYMRYEANLNASEWRGFVIFNTEKGDCFHCHSIGLFLDNSFHNIGLDSDFSGTDLGRFAVTGDPADIGKFKTPSLRNVELTAPYMHDGRMATLEEVVEHYNSRVINTETLDPILTKPNHLYGLQLSEQDKSDLVDFLKALTDTAFLHDPGLSKP